MEKIYMEENNRKRKSVVDFSVVLSFAVAFFAVFSLIASGFNRVSYAAPVTDDNITFYNSGAFVSGFNDTKTTYFQVPLYYADSAHTKPLFCIEHNVNVVDSSTGYVKNNQITDYGLLYLLNNSFVNNKKIINDPDSNQYAEAWATQVAIWMYLYETDGNSSNEGSVNYIKPDDLTKIQNTTQISVHKPGDISNDNDRDFGVSIYSTYIKPVVDAAKTASALKQISITKGDGEITKTDDGKFYQTPVISVVGTPSSDLISYDINLSGIDGAIAVDENGNSLNLTNITPDKKFYVRIPSDKVTEKAQNLNIGVTGHFKTLTGHEYHAATGSYQKVVTVTGDTTDVSNGLTIEVVGAPDTGMNTAQTIYFIGLIVLLCGVGIVYANAKPVESKQ